MSAGEPNHTLMIHFNKNRYMVKDVSSARYTHQDLMNDVSEQALKELPGSINLYLTVKVPVPGSAQTMLLKDDGDMRAMFQMYRRTENIHVVLKVSATPLATTVDAPPPRPAREREQLVQDGRFRNARPARPSGDVMERLAWLESELNYGHDDWLTDRRAYIRNMHAQGYSAAANRRWIENWASTHHQPQPRALPPPPPPPPVQQPQLQFQPQPEEELPEEEWAML